MIFYRSLNLDIRLQAAEYLFYYVECSAGYFDVNCSKPCPKPNYGMRCSQTCNCFNCHHVYGCATGMASLHL